uniref:Deoxyuridine 5'-triphosphate nucleotidohydrolase n=1 Tax=Timema monikensis TaxID=170555 RepID=A0A7R9EJB1_9NEOP|nr:unnamed protein product [Timema monikensis]
MTILPKWGYKCGDRQSAKAIKWLVYLEKTRPDIHIQHAFNGREIEILGRKVDGYCEMTREIFEFDGCFFHGCTCLSNRDVAIIGTKETLTERYECTLLIYRTFRVAGYNLSLILVSSLLKYKKINRNAFSPVRATTFSAGLDLKSPYNCSIQPSCRRLVKINISIILPAETYGRISPRSSLALHHGIDVLAGVIDEDYRSIMDKINASILTYSKKQDLCLMSAAELK